MTEPSSADVDLLLGQVGWLRQLARQLSGDPHLGEDLAQDAWVAALTRRPSQDRPLGPWLAHVVRNLLRDSRRDDAHRRQREHASSRSEATTSAAELVERAELHRRLVDAVLALEEPYRSAILMRYLGELSPREIASKLGVPDRTVHTRLARGLEHLRRKLRAPRGEHGAWIGVLFGRKHLSRSPSLVPMAGAVLMNAKWVKIALVALFLSLLGVWGSVQWSGSVGGMHPGEKADASSFASELPQVVAREENTSNREVLEESAAKESLLATPDPERSLYGVVVTPGGDPIDGAEIRILLALDRHLPTLSNWEEEGQLIETRWTNSRGEFLVPLVPGRTYDLEASSEGRARRRSTNLYAGESVRVVLEPEAVVLGHVTVGEDGTPVPGAIVSLEPGVVGSPGGIVYRAETDATGGFRIDRLSADFFWLEVRSPEYPALSRELVLGSGEARRLDIVLERGTQIRGRVTDGETKLPIQGARVALDWTRRHVTSTDDQGDYVLGGVTPNSSASVYVSAKGYGDWTMRVFSVPLEGATQDLFLLPGRIARGRILDQAGMPVAGARVYAESRRYADFGEQTESRSTLTGETGSFQLESLRVDGRHTLLIRAEDFATAVYDFPASEWSTKEIDFGDIRLASPSSLAGRVVDPEGAPIPDLWVLLSIEPVDRDRFGPAITEISEGYASSEGFGTGRVMARTDARGRFFFDDMPAGSYELSAGDKGFARRGNLHVDLGDSEQRDVEIVFDVGLSIGGTLVDADGRPIPSTAVDVYPSGHAWTDPTRSRLTYNLSRVDGSFVLRGLDPGTYDLEVRAHQFAGLETLLGRTRWTGIAAGASDLRLEVARGAYVDGAIVGPDGSPAPGCSVFAVIDGESEPNYVSDGEGRFRIPCPEGRPVDLVAWPSASGVPGSTSFILDAQGAWDQSYNATLKNVLPGTPGIVLRLPKLP